VLVVKLAPSERLRLKPEWKLVELVYCVLNSYADGEAAEARARLQDTDIKQGAQKIVNDLRDTAGRFLLNGSGHGRPTLVHTRDGVNRGKPSVEKEGSQDIYC
jgi:hypothetical protein